MTNVNSVQPLALVHNNEIVCIEKNDQTIQKKFSCFKIFKLKGPIDVNLLLNIIFPSSERNHYDLEISEYNGRSSKVKFSFTSKTHNDLIQHIQNAAAKVYDISENGLADWLASDTITFKSIYQNTDTIAIQQIQNTDDTDSYDVFYDASDYTDFSDVSDYYTDFSDHANDDFSDVSDYYTDFSDVISQSDLQLYPMIDEKSFERELKELSERISLQKDHDLEGLFHNIFQRKDLTITIKSLTNDFFGQINNIVAFLSKDQDHDHDKDIIVINDDVNENVMLDSDFACYLFKQVECYIDGVAVGGFMKSCEYGFMFLTLWNLVNTLHSIHLSYRVLLETDGAFKQIFQSQKNDVTSLLSNMDQSLMDLLIILNDEINREKYERLQQRLVDFVKSTENLMNIVMIINNQCNEQLETLENQKTGLTNKLMVAAVTIGISALSICGIWYDNERKKVTDNDTYASNDTRAVSKQKRFEKALRYLKYAAGLAAGLTVGATMIGGYLTRLQLQNGIEKRTNILDQLKSTHLKLSQWKNLGEKYIECDINDINNNRMTFIDEFTKIKLQCKRLNDIFNLIV